MTRIRYVWAAVAIISILLGGGLVRGDSPVAPLNGTISFTSASAQSDTLYVNSGDATIKATSAVKIQGSANSEITVVTTPGSGTVHVADVILREGDSLYHVAGGYVGDGSGGVPATWDAEYNKGVPRILLEVNGTGAADNYVACGDNGGTLTVTLAGGSSETNYTVSLSDSGNGTPAGDVDFSSSSVTVPGGGSQTVNLHGRAVGGVTITGTCPNAASGNATATVMDVVVIFSKAEVRPGVGDAHVETVTATAIRTGGGAAVTVNLTTNNARASVTSGASFTIPEGQNQAQQVVTIRGHTESVTDQDTLLEARIGNDLKNSIPITVTLPTTYTIAGSATSGPWTKSGANTVVWSVAVSITVKDKWGKALGPGWQGSHVQERVKNPGDADYGAACGLDMALLPQNWSPLGADGTVQDVTRGQVEFPLQADALCVNMIETTAS